MCKKNEVTGQPAAPQTGANHRQIQRITMTGAETYGKEPVLG